MTRPLLPPRGIFVPSKLLEMNLKPSVFATAVKLLALTWGRKGDTPELSWEFLEEYTGLKRSQLYGHLSCLASMGVCAWMSRRGGYLIVRYNSGFYPKSNGDLDELSDISDTLIGGGLINNQWDYEFPPPNDLSLSAGTVRKNGRKSDKSENTGDESNLPPHIRERLTEIDVFPELFGEIERLAWSDRDILDLVDAVKATGSDTPGALFIHRIRRTARPMSEEEKRQSYQTEGE